jgi:hypothetical protein
MSMPVLPHDAPAHFGRLVAGLVVRAIGISLTGAVLLAGTLTLLSMD